VEHILAADPQRGHDPAPLGDDLGRDFSVGETDDGECHGPSLAEEGIKPRSAGVSGSPILEGERAERALEVVRAVLAAETEGPELDALPPTLDSGKAGVALLHGYAARAGLGAEHEATSRRLLDAAVDALA